MTTEHKDKRPRNSRDEILDAAEKVVRDQGANHLTIDAVARVSGLSKGGVLYNFPSKQALLTGMVERAFERHEALIEERRSALDGPNKTLRAILKSQPEIMKQQPVACAFLAAIAEDPSYADRIQPVLRVRYDQIIAEADDPEQALVIWMAFEGLMLSQALGLTFLPDDAKERVEARLHEVLAQ